MLFALISEALRTYFGSASRLFWKRTGLPGEANGEMRHELCLLSSKVQEDYEREKLQKMWKPELFLLK